MLYERNGKEPRFTNLLDPEPRGRRVFIFHRPGPLITCSKAELRTWTQAWKGSGRLNTNVGRLETGNHVSSKRGKMRMMSALS